MRGQPARPANRLSRSRTDVPLSAQSGKHLLGPSLSGFLTQMYGPAVRSKKISTIRRWRSCINVSGLCLERRAPGHHGYQRACDLISGPASSRPFGSPVFACAGKTEPPFRLVLSQTSADNKLAKWSRHLKPVRLEGATASQHTPGDTRELVGKRDRQHVPMQPFVGGLDPMLKPVALPSARFNFHENDPRRLDE